MALGILSAIMAAGWLLVILERGKNTAVDFIVFNGTLVALIWTAVNGL